MLRLVAPTSIEAYYSHENNEFKDQFDQVEWMVVYFWWRFKQWPVNKELAAFYGWEAGTISGRVNHLVASNRLFRLEEDTRLPDSRFVKNKKCKRGQVVRVNPTRLKLLLPKMKELVA